jgi:hypothetical protein
MGRSGLGGPDQSQLLAGTQARRRRDRGRRPGVDGVDDLRAVDALQVNRRDPEVGVPELALDDDQRDALMSHLDGVSVSELVRREAAPDAR